MGPPAAVLVGREPTEVDRRIVRDFTKSLGAPGPGGETGPDVLVVTTRRVGGTYIGAECPFWLEWQDGGYNDLPTARAKIEDAFGLTPRASLLVSAGMNRAADHRVLGETVLQLALALHGVIDFDGALLPIASPARVEPVDWSEVTVTVRDLLSTVPGRVIAIEYEVNDSRVWAWHVGDCEFIRGWLQHPEFHMIK